MLKLSYRYDQTSVRLLVDGLPDLSAGQTDDVIGIILSWRLQLVAAPEVKGEREHLEALVICVLSYARYCLSGIRTPFGGSSSPVRIYPDGEKHRLDIYNNINNIGVNPSSLILDDAELADLVRCLDNLRLDSRILVCWSPPPCLPLHRHELDERVPVLHRFAAPLTGIGGFMLTAGIALLFPIPPTLTEAQPNTVVPNTVVKAVNGHIGSGKYPSNSN